MTGVVQLSFHATVVAVSEAFASNTRIEIAIEQDCNEIPAFFGDLIVAEYDGRDAKVGDIWSFVCTRVAKKESLG